MDGNLTLADIAAVTKDSDAFSGNGLWIFALLLLMFGGGGGFGYGRTGEFGQYATAASQQDILFGQKVSDLDNKMDRLGNGIADATFALNNSVTTEGRNMQMQLAECCCKNQANVDSVRFDMSNYAAAIQANDTANTQKVLDALAQNKIESLQGRIQELEMANAMCGVPRISPYGYGITPNFCGCGCNTAYNI